MKDQMEKRLKELKAEFESGQKMLAEMKAKQANLRNTLLRISGAIQVIEEELAKQKLHPGNGEGHGVDPEDAIAKQG
jgi:septal ring factor EnvC (AmiA/AmiB activator)